MGYSVENFAFNLGLSSQESCNIHLMKSNAKLQISHAFYVLTRLAKILIRIFLVKSFWATPL